MVRRLPITRGPGWLAILDHGVDIVIATDGAWSWKDLDDPDELVREGRTTSEVLSEIRTRSAAEAADPDADRRWWATWDDWVPGARR